MHQLKEQFHILLRSNKVSLHADLWWITAGLLKKLHVKMMARESCRQVVTVGHTKTRLKIT